MRKDEGGRGYAEKELDVVIWRVQAVQCLRLSQVSEYLHRKPAISSQLGEAVMLQHTAFKLPHLESLLRDLLGIPDVERHDLPYRQDTSSQTSSREGRSSIQDIAGQPPVERKMHHR